MKIYIDGLGDRDAIKDIGQIAWFIDSVRKYRGKRQATKILLDLYFKYGTKLIENECFEILTYLKHNLTDKQITNRMLWRAKQQKAWVQQDLEIREHFRRIQAKQRLLSGMNCN